MKRLITPAGLILAGYLALGSPTFAHAATSQASWTDCGHASACVTSTENWHWDGIQAFHNWEVCQDAQQGNLSHAVITGQGAYYTDYTGTKITMWCNFHDAYGTYDYPRMVVNQWGQVVTTYDH